MSEITPRCFTKPFQAELHPPGSKRLTHRALILAAIAQGKSVIRNILLTDDMRITLDSLRKLGFDLRCDEANRTVYLSGTSGEVPARGTQLPCGHSRTALRFLAALCALGRGEFTLDATPPMRQHPIAEFGEMLKNIGVRLSYPEIEGFPPICIDADRLPGGRLHHGPSQSSQYLSALLLIAPYARNEIHIDLDHPQTGWPHIAMTMRLMDEFSHTPELIRDDDTHLPEQIIIPRGAYVGREYTIEPDASSAACFLAAAAIHEGSKLTIENLGKHSLQADVGFGDLLHQMGADLVFGRDFLTITGTSRLQGIDVSLADMPDMAHTLAVVALFAEGPTTLRDLHALRVRETDHLAALANELKKLGAQVEIEDDSLTIEPPDALMPAAIDTYDDHRMAMAFAIAATRTGGITIRDPVCVTRTYPGFFDDLDRLGR